MQKYARLNTPIADCFQPLNTGWRDVECVLVYYNYFKKYYYFYLQWNVQCFFVLITLTQCLTQTNAKLCSCINLLCCCLLYLLLLNVSLFFEAVSLSSTPILGDIIRWEQQVRLRHMTTRKYLCIDENHDILLTDDNEDPKTVFRLHSVLSVRWLTLPSVFFSPFFFFLSHRLRSASGTRLLRIPSFRTKINR